MKNCTQGQIIVGMGCLGIYKMNNVDFQIQKHIMDCTFNLFSANPSIFWNMNSMHRNFLLSYAGVVCRNCYKLDYKVCYKLCNESRLSYMTLALSNARGIMMLYVLYNSWGRKFTCLSNGFE